MNVFELVRDLLRQFSEQYPTVLIDRRNRAAVTESQQHGFVQLLAFARALQITHPVYEAAYQHLVHQFVLYGSRANLLAALDRRLQATIAGHGALTIIDGVSGIGKTSLAMVLGVHAQELGALCVIGRCHEQGATPFWLWHEVIRSIRKLAGSSSDHLAAPFGDGTEAQSVEHLIHSLADWLIACSAEKPLVD